MSWPRQDNGTVDWEAVFEDPDIGLKAYLKGAKTIMAIGQCAHVIVQSLFTREGDLAYRIAFSAAIDEVIHSAKSEQQARDRLDRLATEIKENRILYAADFLGRDDAPEDNKRSAHDPTEVLKVLGEGE